MDLETIKERVRKCGTCECVERCAEEDGLPKPNRYGVCEVEAGNAGWVPDDCEEDDDAR